MTACFTAPCQYVRVEISSKCLDMDVDKLLDQSGSDPEVRIDLGHPSGLQAASRIGRYLEVGTAWGKEADAVSSRCVIAN
jgi:hypothetical protein